jgi:hypothetical protein
VIAEKGASDSERGGEREKTTHTKHNLEREREREREADTHIARVNS